jgi:hypothetical protein
MRFRYPVAIIATAMMLGCGAFGQMRQSADNISAIGEVASKLQDSDQLTYTADYQLGDGTPATVTQQPPNAAIVSRSGRFVATPRTVLVCGAQNSCQSALNRTGEFDLTNADLVPSAVGAELVPVPTVLAMLSSGAINSDAKVVRTTRKIGGQPSTCLKISGIRNEDHPGRHAFTVCVTRDGVLSAFAGDVDRGRAAHLELTGYRTTVDPQSFGPPPGSQVSNVDRIQPTTPEPAAPGSIDQVQVPVS